MKASTERENTERKPSEPSKLSIVNLEPREKLQKEKFKEANSLRREIWRKSEENNSRATKPIIIVMDNG